MGKYNVRTEWEAEWENGMGERNGEKDLERCSIILYYWVV